MKMKKAIISIVLAIMFLTMACVGTTANDKSDNDHPNIQKITFVHYAKSDDFNSKPIWDDTFDRYKFLFPTLELKWADTMTYEVNSDGSGLDHDIVMGVLEDSLETWNTAITGDFVLFDAPITLEDTVTPGENDDRNIVIWEDLGDRGPIAYNSLWFDTTTMNIIDSDVIFNSYYAWNTTGASTDMDLQNIATHEFGHNGLGDLYGRPSMELTMHGRSSYGETIKRTLGNGDILGIKALYG